MINREQYKICKERGGHTSNGEGFTNSVAWATTWYTCKFCGARYRFEPSRQVEMYDYEDELTKEEKEWMRKVEIEVWWVILSGLMWIAIGLYLIFK